MKTWVQVILLILFSVLSIAFLVPSVMVIAHPASDGEKFAPPVAPQRPEELNAENLENYARQVEVYSEEVGIFLKLFKESIVPRWHSTYGLVVKDTLGELFSKLIMAFMAYAFVKGTAGVVNNLVLLMNDKDPEKISLF